MTDARQPSGAVRIRERILDSAEILVPREALRTLQEEAAAVVLPEKLVSSKSGTTAAFRQATYDLRAAAAQSGIGLKLATPEGAQPGLWEEHAADIILPVLSIVASGVAAELIAAYVLRLAARRKLPDRLTYRELRTTPSGGLYVREIAGHPEAVLAAIRTEAADTANSPGTELR